MNNFDDGIDEPSFSSNKSTDDPKLSSELVFETVQYATVTPTKSKQVMINFMNILIILLRIN